MDANRPEVRAGGLAEGFECWRGAELVSEEEAGAARSAAMCMSVLVRQQMF